MERIRRDAGTVWVGPRDLFGMSCCGAHRSTGPTLWSALRPTPELPLVGSSRTPPGR
jgi:hypothetical protein